jgi:Fe-S-cluster containining protein
MNTSNLRSHFKRTICACQGCKELCHRIPGCLIPGDIGLIADHLKITSEQVIDNYLLASPGAIVASKGVVFRIPTIVPDRDKTGKCCFLNDNQECTIHPVAPFGCAYFDCQIGVVEGQARSREMLIAIAGDRAYQDTHKCLWSCGRVAPAPETLRALYKGI